MISKRVVKQYLNRNLDSFEWIKEASERDIEHYFSKLPIKPEFHGDPPFLHQKQCFVLGITQSKFLFFLQMGLGKTRIILDVLSYRIKCHSEFKTLVLVPNVVNIENWIKEASKYRPDIDLVPLFGDTEQRLKDIEKPGHLFVINYAGFVYMMTDPSKRKKKGGGRIINKRRIAEIANKFDGIVCDESHMIKSHKSLSYQITNAFASYCSFRYGLTGTPFGRDPHDLWTQFHVIDRGETLGHTLSIYRQAFFTTRVNYWGGYEYNFDKRRQGKLHRMLQNLSIYYAAKDCINLPEQTYIQRYVQFPNDMKTYYNQVIEKIKAAGKDYSLMESAFMNMRQLCSGFLNYRDEEDEKLLIEFDCPKLQALEDILLSLESNDKIVIFHEFIHSGNKISELLTSLKIKHVCLSGATKDPTAVLREFVTDPNCIAFVANSKSGSTGLNLQCSQYVCFWETPVSPIVREQSEKRIHRPGQKSNTVFYYDLIVQGSIEETLYSYLREGKDLFKALIEGDEKIKPLL